MAPHRAVLVWLAAGALASSAASARAASKAPASNPAARFKSVKSWTAKFRITVDAQKTVEMKVGDGTMKNTITLHESSDTTARLGKDDEGGLPTAWGGPAKGSATADDRSLKVVQGKDGSTTIDIRNRGRGSTGEATTASLFIDVEKGTYSVHCPGVELPVETTTDFVAQGAGYTQKDHKSEKGTGNLWGVQIENQPLPATGLALEGKASSRETLQGIGEDAGIVEGDKVCQWSLVPSGEAPKLEAKPGGPYKVGRGEWLALDASQSRGEITEYTWDISFSCPEGVSPPELVERHDAQTALKVLCAPKVRLTVSDGAQQKTTEAAVQFLPREFKTTFEHVAKEDPQDLLIPAVVAGSGKFIGGVNLCAKDGDGGHTIHPAAGANGSWRDAGYRLEQVADPAGPFDGWWYVASTQLEVSRQTRINKYILPNGPPCYRGDPKNFYQANVERKADVAGYLAAVRAHEGMGVTQGQGGHSFLLKRELERDDPAKRLEELLDPGSDTALRDRADALLKRRERQLCEATKDPLAQTWSGKLWFCEPAGGFASGDTSVGGPRYGGMACE